MAALVFRVSSTLLSGFSLACLMIAIDTGRAQADPTKGYDCPGALPCNRTCPPQYPTCAPDDTGASCNCS